MTIQEAKEYISWFKNNHLPEHINFIEKNSGKRILLDNINDKDVLSIVEEFSAKCASVNGIA